jgi:hypothetical protein
MSLRDVARLLHATRTQSAALAPECARRYSVTTRDSGACFLVDGKHEFTAADETSNEARSRAHVLLTGAGS